MTTDPAPAPAAMTDDDLVAALIGAEKLSPQFSAKLLVFRAALLGRLGELTRIRTELAELVSEGRKPWDRTESFEYQDGREDARDLMGQQVQKILNGATAKEVQAWLKR